MLILLSKRLARKVIPMAVNIGELAPDFTLPSQKGVQISLSEYRGKKNVVIYFYPKDDTPGCTAESCGFRDQYHVFQGAGAEVIGISADSPESHQRFASRYQLPFTLLSDTGNRVRKLFGVPSTLGILPGRVTYVIDKNGVIRHIFNSQLDFQGHVNQSLQILQTLNA